MDRVTRRSLLVRSAVLWLLLRIIYSGVSALAGGGLVLTWTAIPLFAGIVAVVVLLDLRALREDILLANLAVGARHVFALACGVAACLEAAITAGAGLFG